MKFILLSAVVFVATVAADYAWSKWMMHVAAKRAHWAGVWSAAIIACGAVNIVSYTQNMWLILPMLLGAYCGTYLAVTRELTSTSELDKDAAFTPVTQMAGPTPTPGFPCHKRPQSEWCDRDGPGGFMGHTCRPKPCDHRNCTVTEQDGDLLRWSCGRIDG